MNAYYIGLYKSGTPFSENIVQSVLTSLKKVLPEFFPARLQTDESTFHTITTAEDFNYGLIPNSYWIENGLSVRIPLLGNNQVELNIVDDRESIYIPSSIVLKWKEKRELPETTRLELLLLELINATSPTYARLSNESIVSNDTYYERSFSVNEAEYPAALYWITWFGPQQLKVISVEQLDALRSFPEIGIQACADGKLVTLTHDVFDEGNPAHLQLRKEAEGACGLTAIYKSL